MKFVTLGAVQTRAKKQGFGMGWDDLVALCTKTPQAMTGHVKAKTASGSDRLLLTEAGAKHLLDAMKQRRAERDAQAQARMAERLAPKIRAQIAEATRIQQRTVIRPEDQIPLELPPRDDEVHLLRSEVTTLNLRLTKLEGKIDRLLEMWEGDNK